MEMLLEQTKKWMQQYAMVQNGQTVAAALSGGMDSVCLLHLLLRLQPEFGYRLTAVHVHHGLRKEADSDEAFCRALCSRWQIPLQVYRVDVSSRVKETGESVEEAARILRYRVLAQQGADRIALAHHQQDQAETVLLHLLRGSGLTGLCGMQAVRLPYIRPLLYAEKEQIRAYIQEHRLLHVEDASNADTAFRRNRIRHELLPMLQQAYNPEIVRALAQTAQRLQEEEAYLQSRTPELPEGGLPASWVMQYPVNIQKRLLRRWLAREGLKQDVQQVHLEQLLDLLQGPTGRRISLPKGLTVEKSYDILNICKSIPNDTAQLGGDCFWMERIPIAQARQQWNGREQVPALPEEKWLSADGLGEPVWRTRQPGDYIVAAGGRKKLKEFLIDEKVPRALRGQIPLLADGSHVLWVYGYRISDGARITENTQQVLHVRRI